jgi:hypothetical protein
MRHLFFSAALLLALPALPPAAQAQTISPKASQTIRGTVLDAGAKAPVIGATVVVVGVEPALGGTTGCRRPLPPQRRAGGPRETARDQRWLRRPVHQRSNRDLCKEVVLDLSLTSA